MRPATLLLLCCALLCAQPSSARKRTAAAPTAAPKKADEVTRGGFHITGGRTVFKNYTFESFERFRTAYNEINATRLQTPLGGLTPAGGWWYGAGAHGRQGGMAMYFSFTGGRTDATATARLRNGDEREMRVEMTPITMNFDFLFSIRDRVFFGWALGGDFGKATLYSGYRYAGDDRISYGTDQPLNGIYRFRGNNTINLGGRVDVKIVPQVRLTVRGEYVGTFMGKQKGAAGTSGYELLPHRDELYGNSSSGGVHIDGFNHFYLVESPAAANNDYVYYVGQGNNFAKTFRGWRIQAGVVIDIKTWDMD